MEDDQKKWKTNQSTKINQIGCDTIVNLPSLDRKDLELQFKLYYNELKRLIEEDEVCREKVELFLFQDYASKETGNFSSRLKKQIKKIKMRDQSRE